jgi:hypothetical protein
MPDVYRLIVPEQAAVKLRRIWHPTRA